MRSVLLKALAVMAFLPATQAFAQTPSLQWGWDTRAMSQADCLSKAKFAMGEQQPRFQICGTDASTVAGCGPDVVVAVTCFPVGTRTFINVVGSSLNGDTAGRYRNSVRSLVMGPAN